MKAMHPRLQRQMRILDRWEREFLAAVRKLLQARVNALEPVVKAALEPGGEKVIEKLGRLRALPGDYLPLLERYVGHLLVEGMVQGRSDVEFLRSRLQRRGVRLAARVDGEPVIPEDAIDFIRHRRDLGRFFEQDQVDTVRTILDNGLKEGATVNQVMDALRIALPEAIGKARAENIARTEATTAFNQGRLAAFRETKGFVGAVEFMAITDARTTPICMERDGLVLAIDDPRLPDNTPPLHYMCRSVLSPVSGLELEDLGGKDYLDKQREKLDKLPPPLKGFGNEPGLEGGRPPGQPPVVRTPRGPKGGDEGEARGPREVHVDGLPSGEDQGERPSEGTDPIHLPPGLMVVTGPGVSIDSQVVRGILAPIVGLPPEVLAVLQRRGIRLEFDGRNPFDGDPVRVSPEQWSEWRRKVDSVAAMVLTGLPGEKDITMLFRPPLLLAQDRDLRKVAFHETGHAIYRALNLEGDEEVVRAYLRENHRLPQTFRKNESEFVAEGFRFYHSNWVLRAYLSARASTLHGIIAGRMNAVRLQETPDLLFEGPEGVAGLDEDLDRVVFVLDVGRGLTEAEVDHRGRMRSFSGHSESDGGIHVAWSTQKVWTPEEAEPYKAFLRSKGVTLPHVMS